MKVLYLSYWGVNDGLTASVIYPHLDILSENEKVESIYFLTLERGEDESLKSIGFNSKVKHIPLRSRNFGMNVFNKINDFILFPREIRKILKKGKIDQAYTHGMVGGSLLHLTCPKLSIPYYVFSEPHSLFMLESGVWSSKDPRYLFQKKWEDDQIKSAAGLWSVTQNYLDLLEDKYKVKTARFAPNAVDFERFSFNSYDRDFIRKELGIEADQIVGIYVGKFGGIYLEERAFEIFRRIIDLIPSFQLIILSPQDEESIKRLANSVGFDTNFIIRKVTHDEVAKYLSAADFGISVQNPKPSNLFLCPLKNGEYWASGLPIFSIKDVGDDTVKIEADGGLGAVFELNDLNSIDSAVLHIQNVVSNNHDRLNNVAVQAVQKYKDIQIVRDLFNESIR